MSVGLFSLRRPARDGIERLLTEQRARSLTYAHVGATRDANQPPGYRHDLWRLDLGVGDTLFERAREGLRCWAAHRGVGIEVFPADAPVMPGESVVLVLPVLGLYAMAACRVVWTLDEERSFGFGYGTLPGHPESGEEAFVVRRGPGSSVALEIHAFSRPVHPLGRAGGPVTRWLQLCTIRRYLRGMLAWTSN